MEPEKKRNSMDSELKREIVASVIGTFDWSKYGLDQVDDALNVDRDEWVDALAADIVEAL